MVTTPAVTAITSHNITPAPITVTTATTISSTVSYYSYSNKINKLLLNTTPII